MEKKIEKICIIGSGVMGLAIASLVANSSNRVVLLDVVSNDPNDRNAILTKALENIEKQQPAPLSHPSKLAFITIGNLEDDLKLITECDLIIEVIIEKIAIKHQLYEKILPYLKEYAILASNTSTLPLRKLKEQMPDSIKSTIRSRFVISHFFNPPRYMELLELIVDSEVSSGVIERISDFLIRDLGKTIIKCHDTPGFIANRVGCYLLELVVRSSIDENLSPVIIDKIFTDLFKLPSTGIFGLYDLIGHDVIRLISTSLVNSLPNNDDYHQVYSASSILDKMIENNLIGRKALGGFYRISKINGIKTKEVIDFTTLTYAAFEKPKIEYSSIDQLLNSNSSYGKFFHEILVRFYLYITSLIPSVTDNIYDIDTAMRLGYSWEIGPFELLNNHIGGGFEWLKKQAMLMNLTLPEYITNNSYETIELSQFHLTRVRLEESKILLKNDSAQLVLYKNRLVFTINTKMNCLNENVFKLLLESVDIAENEKQTLYIMPLTNNFSAGADLKFIASCIKNQDFAKLEDFLKLGQKTMIRLKYSHINIVSCALGAALGGGCEILLHSDFIVANQELNAGLVEVSVGLVPSWGGIKEMFYRASNDKSKLVKNLRNILLPNKSSSADYFIADYDITNVQVNMNKHLILQEAFALDLPEKIKKVSKQVILSKVTLAEEFAETNFSKQKSIAEYDNLQGWLLSKFQDIISMQQIDEQKLLQFEREIFLELAKNPKKIFGF
ncbi:MAG: 3-hydroxyacyl-CoA dehydrogenase/enoyl-CoA hydratase family protein [Candidatus Tisiphia sp.]